MRPGPVETNLIKSESAAASISWRTIERAKSSLKVQAFKDSETFKWKWTLDGPPEDGDEDRKEKDEGMQVGDTQLNLGGLGGDGVLQNVSKTANLGGDGVLTATTTTTIKNKGYIREDRQDRQDRQPSPNGVRTNIPTEDRQDRQLTEDRQPTEDRPAAFDLRPGETATVAELRARREQEGTVECIHSVPGGCWLCKKGSEGSVDPDYLDEEISEEEIDRRIHESDKLRRGGHS